MSYEALATSSPDHYMELLVRLQELGRACTCATTPMSECPNYIPELDDIEEDTVRAKNPRTGEWEDLGPAKQTIDLPVATPPRRTLLDQLLNPDEDEEDDDGEDGD